MRRMSIVIRSVLLLPILPPFFRLWIAVVRSFGLLPKRSVSIQRSKRILIVNLTPHVGDIVMMLPFLEKLHTEHPEIVLQVAVSKPMGSIFKAIPFFEHVHEIEFKKRRSPILDQYACIATIFQYATQNFVTTSYDLCLLPRWGRTLSTRLIWHILQMPPYVVGRIQEKRWA